MVSYTVLLGPVTLVEGPHSGLRNSGCMQVFLFSWRGKESTKKLIHWICISKLDLRKWAQIIWPICVVIVDMLRTLKYHIGAKFHVYSYGVAHNSIHNKAIIWYDGIIKARALAFWICRVVEYFTVDITFQTLKIQLVFYSNSHQSCHLEIYL